ncbi:MAG: hypothetical protein KDK25_02570, partial [Leptospiraceae bacterium]|nr:hypothetical protein [Leptospiraceae bacterium]
MSDIKKPSTDDTSGLIGDPSASKRADAAGNLDRPEVLFEDNHILVCIKPPGVLSQGDASGDPDQLSIIREYIRISRKKPGK